MSKDPKLQGSHQSGCGGKVCDASCVHCGADNIPATKIKTGK